MRVDPEVRNILDIISKMPAPKFSSMDIKDIRKMMAQSPFPEKIEEVAEIKDMSFVDHDNTIPLRLYVPEDSGNGLILFFHGGGFVFGDIQSYDSICRKIANDSGNRVISVEYRLAPENKFPSPLKDGFQVYSWVRSNAEKINIDKSKIVLAGDSAGGNITAGLSLMIKDRGLPLPMMQILFYPMLGMDLFSESMREFGSNYFLTAEDIKFFGDAYLNSENDVLNPYFSPVLHQNQKGLPETIIVTAEYDPLRDQGETYLNTLREAGVKATGIRARGMIHGFMSLFAMVPAAENLITMVFSLVGKKCR